MSLYLSILLFAFASGITPGPNNMMILSSGLNYGIRRSMPHMAGIALGFTFMLLVIGLGMGTLFDRLPILHRIIQVVGVVYMLYLAWKIASAPVQDIQTGDARPFSFWQAFLFQWVNPKAWVMGTGAFATYTNMDSNIYVQMLIITLIFAITTVPCLLVWAGLGASLQHLLQKPAYQQWFNRIMGVLLVLSIIPILMP